jgi:hypothetical protein
MLCVATSYCNAQYHYTECRYVECHGKLRTNSTSSSKDLKVSETTMFETNASFKNFSMYTLQQKRERKRERKRMM